MEQAFIMGAVGFLCSLAGTGVALGVWGGRLRADVTHLQEQDRDQWDELKRLDKEKVDEKLCKVQHRDQWDAAGRG